MINIQKWKNLPYPEKIKYFSKFFIGIHYDFIKSKFKGDLVIHGSYRTGNIGDLSIGKTINNWIETNLPRREVGLNGCIMYKQNFSNYNTYILGGGQLFDSDTFVNKMYPLGTTQSIILGVGFSKNWSASNKKFIKKMELAKLITVRDQQSKKNLSSHINNDIIVTADPAFLFKNKIKSYKSKPIDNSMGVSLRALDKPKSKKFLNFLDKNLKRLSKDYQLYFIPFALEDINFANAYFKKYFTKILPLSSPANTLNTIRFMEKCIGMRFHSCIFSLIAEKPLFVIRYSKKMDGLSKNLSNYVDTDTLKGNEMISFDVKASKIKKVKKYYQNRAKKNIRLLSEFLAD